MSVVVPIRPRRLASGAPQRLDILFARQAARTPFAAALLHRGTEVHYADLERRANRLAWRLLALGAGPGALVGVCMRRSPELVALLAVLKAGAAYVPLDPAYPSERLDFMLADSGAALLVTDCAAHARLAWDGPVLDPVREAPAIAARPIFAPPTAGGAEALAYVIYTSGSTGRPKGVMLGHSAAGLVEWARAAFTRGELARVAAATSVSFDPSVFEIFAPLCTGGTVILKDGPLDPFTPEERPTLLNCVPSVVAELCRMGAIPNSVKAINVGGEPLKAALVREVYRRTRVEAVYNHYGPTEATTCTTVARVPRDVERDPPLGRPIAGAVVQVLDEAGRPVRPGEVGEIHIGGPVLARGYLDRPDLTAERFTGGLFRTGDLGRWSPSGELEFVGRADDQIKLRGHRIEPGEVEAALMRLFAVRRAAAGVRPDRLGRPQLVAWLESDASFTLQGVRTALKDWLPEPMLPTRLCVLPEFPATLSGKLDRNALPAPPEPVYALPAPPAPPAQSRIEEAIAETFKDVLGLERVTADASFFELGGDSLLGVNTVLRLEELLGCSIPSALLHQAPTPRLLARALEQCPACEPRRLNVLAPGGDGVPLFCTADLFGLSFSYLSLARRLAPGRPVYGLSPGPSEAAFVAERSIPVLTRAWLEAVRSVRPQGPYLLAGYSAGALPAFDLACALEAEGEAARLILLDGAIRRPPPLAGLARWAWRKARPLLDPGAVGARLQRLAAMRGKLTGALAPPQLQRPPEWIPAGRAAFARSLMQASARYTPSGFRGPVLMVKCARRDAVDELFDHDRRLGWLRALTGPVTLVEVDSDHHGFMRQPHVAEVADHIRRFLDEPDLGA